MSAGLDTSVVLRLLLGEPEKQAEIAWNFVVDQAIAPDGASFVSDIVVGEAYFALRHHYSVPHGAAVDAIRNLLDDERIDSTGVAPTILVALQRAKTGPGMMDRLIHGEYERDGAIMVTFDRTAASLPAALLLR